MTKKASVKKIACQGVDGSFSGIAARRAFPNASVSFFPSFDGVLFAVKEKKADFAIIPVENSEAGRVADIHTLLPDSGLFIVGEHFLRIEHHLFGVKETSLPRIKRAMSHIQALTQCSNTLKSLKIEPVAGTNTALSAQYVAERNDPSLAAVASKEAGELYGLALLKSNVEDSGDNTTRFLIVSSEQARLDPKQPAITSFVFRVKNKPASLYKCLGGFATNGINILRLESYVDPKNFTSAGFFADILAGPETSGFGYAFEELAFFSEKIQILGTYNIDPYRLKFPGWP